MKQYIYPEAWKILEKGFEASRNEISESLFSIGNGRMGQRANFEEYYSGPSLQGSYIAGIYYPDKTRVGWWKNGYPEYFAKVLNSVNWIGIDIFINGNRLDLAQVRFDDFERELDMQNGLLRRKCRLTTAEGIQLAIASERFYSLEDQDLCLLSYKLEALGQNIQIELSSKLDTHVRNKDSNYDEDFWTDRITNIKEVSGTGATTRKTGFKVYASMINHLFRDDENIKLESSVKDGKVIERAECYLEAGDKIQLNKYVAICSNFYHEADQLISIANTKAIETSKKGYEVHLAAHQNLWQKRWAQNDVVIEGDVSAQQAIRFNILQLFQTYSGEDPRLNIGPKGFTGEKYGGSTYWDTEAYCLPFYLSTAEQEVARNLLIYRHKHLPKAIANAEMLGFTNGAALYPMVTMNGEECHNEWEITFEEIHRNGAIAYAIFDYVRYTGDSDYLLEYGLEVLIGIARFWSQRVNWSHDKKAYVILGVTGPNEYENNVNNNWYTNYIARWCLSYCLESMEIVKAKSQNRFQQLIANTHFKMDEEPVRWKDIVSKMYLPHDADKDLFLQQDGYLDKEDITITDLPLSSRPINQKWSWDRILRSPFIKQADVLQGIYFFESDFTKEQIRKNFEYYESRTVHESSLSPCVHSILAAGLGMKKKAYEMYLRTARLDLDNYNNDTEDGCHITSMAGSWMSIVKGFGGMRIKNNCIHFSPMIPEEWVAYSFKMKFRGGLIEFCCSQDDITIRNLGQTRIHIAVEMESREIAENEEWRIIR